MGTIESIQASGGDYPTPQAWYDAHKGDITSDPNAPYIGEMAAEVFTSLLMDGSSTDASHYFHLRAQANAKFTGDFTGSYPFLKTIVGVGDSGHIVRTTDDYTRLEHFVVGDASGNWLALQAIYAQSATNILFDSLGVWKFGGSVYEASTACWGIRLRESSGAVRNCAVGELISTNTQAGMPSRCQGIGVDDWAGSATVQVFSNAVHDLTATSNGGSTVAEGVFAGGGVNVEIIDNVIGTLTSESSTGINSVTSGTEDIQYNATTDATGGSSSQDNITPGDEFVDTTPATLDLHMKAGGQCKNNGLNLITGGYSNAPTEDCDDEERPNPGMWSIGIDHMVVLGPYRVLAGEVFHAGGTAGQSVVAGKRAGEVFLAGAAAGQIER